MCTSPISEWLRWLPHTRRMCVASIKAEIRNVSTTSKTFFHGTFQVPGSSWEIFTVLTFQNMEDFRQDLHLTLTKWATQMTWLSGHFLGWSLTHFQWCIYTLLHI